MLSQFIQKKLQIIFKPLPFLTIGQCWFLKSFLLCLDHLVCTENCNQQTLTSEPIIFALNHNCAYESILVPSHLIFLREGRKISFVTDWMFGRIPILSWVFKQIDPVYVYNKPSTIPFLNQYRSSDRFPVYDECVKRLSNGQSIGIFPEGSRNRDPEYLLKGRKGIGYIALHSKAPVLPIGIDFPNRSKKGRIPKFGQLILRAGTKMTFPEEITLYHQINTTSDLSPLLKKQFVEYLSTKITYSIMQKIANLSGKQYPFPEPVPPEAMKRFLFNQVLTG